MAEAQAQEQAEGLKKIDALRAGGFSQQEIDAWEQETRNSLYQGGFTDKEVNEYFGQKEFNPQPLKDYFKNELSAAQQQQQAGESASAKPAAHGLYDSFMTGLQGSSGGLLIRGGLPDKTMDEKATFGEKLAHSAGMMVGDLPASALGAAEYGAEGSILPGAGTVAAAGFGAMAVPAALRRIMMDHYEKGEIKTGQEFWDRASGIFADFMKEGVVGAATAGTGQVVGKAVTPLAEKMASPITKASIQTGLPLASEVVANTVTGSAMQGKLPDMDDFANAAIMTAGMHVAMTAGGKAVSAAKGAAQDYATSLVTKDLQQKFMHIYAETGLEPSQVALMAEKDPALHAELMSSSQDVPTSLDWARDKQATPESKTVMVDAPEITTQSEALGPGEEPAKIQVQAKPAEENSPKVENAGETPAPETPKKLTEEEISKLSLDQAHEIIREHISPSKDRPSRFPTLDEMNRSVLDDLDPVLRLMKEALGEKTATGVMKAVDAIKNPYLLMRNTRGNVGRAKVMIDDHTYDFNTLKENGKGLKEILKPFDRKSGELEKFENFLVAARTVELGAREIETGMNVDVANKIFSDPGQKAKYGQAAKDLVDYQNRVLGYLHDSGVLSSDDYARIIGAGEHYVPFFRLIEDDKTGIGKGLKVQNPLKKIEGSKSKIIDPIESIIRKTYEYVALAERNRALRALKEFGENNPGFMEKVAVDQKPETVSKADQAAMDELGLGQAGMENGELVRQHKKLGDDEIAVYENGRREVFKVDKDVAKAVSAMDIKSLNFVERMLALPASTLRAGATLTPDFILRNVVRDQAHAYVASHNGYKPIIDYMSGLMSLIKQDDAYMGWLKGGGMSSAVVSMERNYIEQHVMKLSKETGFMRSAHNVIASPLESMRILAELGETPTRIGEFKRSTKGDTSASATMKGAYDARNVTLDFQKRGAKITAINAMIPFWNAKNQGLSQFYEMMKERPKQTMFKAAAAIVMPSVLTWLASKDDPRYEELKPWEKDLFWIVMTDDWQNAPESEAKGHVMGRQTSDGKWQINRGSVYRIPKPQELGIMFGSSIERSLDAFFTDHPDKFDDFRHTVFDMVLPDVAPVVPKAVVEHLTNYNFFNNQKIVPYDREKLLPELRYAPYTSETAKYLSSHIADLSDVIGLGRSATVSPAVMDHYVNSFFGSAGRYALGTLDWSLQKMGVTPAPEMPEEHWMELPFVRAFNIRFPSAHSRSVEKFYNNYEEIKQWVDSAKALEKEGDATAYGRVVQSGTYSEMEAAMSSINDIMEGMRDAKQAVADISKSDMPAHDKRQAIDDIYWSRIGLAKMGNHIIKQVQEEMKKAQKR